MKGAQIRIQMEKFRVRITPHEVKSILGEPDFIDTITDIDQLDMMWSYTKLNVQNDCILKIYF